MIEASRHGEALRKIRTNLGYSRDKVASLTGINRDTLRRIEKSETVPKLETLEILSECYNVNLLSVINREKQNPFLTELYARLDFVLNNGEQEDINEKLREILLKIEELKETKINTGELLQFEEYILILEEFYAKDKKAETLTDKIINLLGMNNSNFSMNRFKKINYSFLEVRMLFTLSTMLILSEQHKLAIEILEFLNSNIKYFIFDYKLLENMQIKIYTNLATATFILEDDEATLRYCNEAIDYCLKNDTMYNLHLLYFRKAVSLNFLKKNEKENTKAKKKENMYEDPKKYFDKSYELLRIKEKYDLLEKYIELSKEYESNE